MTITNKEQKDESDNSQCNSGRRVLAAAASADIVVPEADGSDGAFNPPQSTAFTVDLGKAVTGSWDDPGGDVDGDGYGDGVYDPDKWAVVFKYSSVNIPSATGVYFKNHSSRAPVVWLVSDDVTIAGTVNLNGSTGYYPGSLPVPATPGPGGFQGGTGHYAEIIEESAGYGPGGSRIEGASTGYPFGGSYGSTAINGGAGSPGPLYGNTTILPLIGGSGGAGYSISGSASYGGAGAGAGGGAILIASQVTIALSGSVTAYGGGAVDGLASGGSGGAIRLVSDTISGSGQLRATGGSGGASTGGVGRIRVEANQDFLNDQGAPVYVGGFPCATATLWPDAAAPVIRVVSVGNESTPDEPLAALNTPDIYLVNGEVTVVIETENVPLDWVVTLRAVLLAGPDINLTAVHDSGNEAFSTWTADLSLTTGYSTLQAGQIVIDGQCNGGARGCTPPVLSALSDSQVSALSLEVTRGGQLIMGGSALLDITGVMTVGPGSSVMAGPEGSEFVEASIFTGSLFVIGDSSGVASLKISDAVSLVTGGDLIVDGSNSCEGEGARGGTPPVISCIENGLLFIGGDLVIAEGEIFMASSAPVELQGDFDNLSTLAQFFDWDQAALVFDGSGFLGQSLEAAGEDRLFSDEGFDTNFDFHTLELSPGAQINIIDSHDNQLDGMKGCGLSIQKTW